MYGDEVTGYKFCGFRSQKAREKGIGLYMMTTPGILKIASKTFQGENNQI